MNFLVMKNNNFVIKGNNHVQQYHLPSSKGEYWIFLYYSSIDFRIILFSDSDTYFWLWLGLLGLISRYLYAHEGRPLLNTEKHQLIHILKWQRNFISLSYLKTKKAYLQVVLKVGFIGFFYANPDFYSENP